MKSFIIIGGGASGVLVAAQLLRSSDSVQVRIFESSGSIGTGIAYSTENPHHLLNVRASNMTAFPDEPDHFVNWLRKQNQPPANKEWLPQSFAPRCMYRAYLQGLLAPYLAECPARINIETSEVVDITSIQGKPQVTGANGETYSADALIIATGNETAIRSSTEHVTEYWSSTGYFDFTGDEPVAILGTGLSMIDSVISLLDKGFKGQVFAFSRRGLLPASHKESKTFSINREDLPMQGGVVGFLKFIRRIMRKNDDWRSVIDGLRPHTQYIWACLSPSQKDSFLRHLRPWWDVHRHRMAPEIFNRIAAARRSGQLQVIAAHLVSVRKEKPGIRVAYRKRRHNTAEEVSVGTIIDCRGGNRRFSTTRNPALISLMERGLARPDNCDLGLDVTEHLEIIDRQGKISRQLFAIGPITKGVFWEVTAVPDIRDQAQNIAVNLLNS